MPFLASDENCSDDSFNSQAGCLLPGPIPPLHALVMHRRGRIHTRAPTGVGLAREEVFKQFLVGLECPKLPGKRADAEGMEKTLPTRQ